MVACSEVNGLVSLSTLVEGNHRHALGTSSDSIAKSIATIQEDGDKSINDLSVDFSFSLTNDSDSTGKSVSPNFPKSPLPSPGDKFLSTARVRKRLLEQYARCRSSSSPLSVANRLILQTSSPHRRRNHPDLCRMSAPDLCGISASETLPNQKKRAATRRSFLEQRQKEILERRCSISRQTSSLKQLMEASNDALTAASPLTLPEESSSQDIPTLLDISLRSSSSSSSSSCSSFGSICSGHYDFESKSGAIMSQTSGYYRTTGETRHITPLTDFVSALRTTKSKTDGSWTRKCWMLLCALLFVAAALSFRCLGSQNHSTVPTNIHHHVELKHNTESYKKVGLLVEHISAEDKAVDGDNWEVDKTKRKMLLSSCWV